MNKNRWCNVEIPLATLALKLSEESGEVGEVITDSDPFLNLDEEDFNMAALKHLMVELDHVDFIMTVIRKRVQAAIDSKN